MLPCRQNKRKLLRRPLAVPRSALFTGGAGGAPEAQTGEKSVSVTNANILSLRIRICVYFDDTGTLSLLSHVLAALRSLRAPLFLDPSFGTSGPICRQLLFSFAFDGHTNAHSPKRLTLPPGEADKALGFLARPTRCGGRSASRSVSQCVSTYRGQPKRGEVRGQ